MHRGPKRLTVLSPVGQSPTPGSGIKRSSLPPVQLPLELLLPPLEGRTPYNSPVTSLHLHCECSSLCLEGSSQLIHPEDLHILWNCMSEPDLSAATPPLPAPSGSVQYRVLTVKDGLVCFIAFELSTRPSAHRVLSERVPHSPSTTASTVGKALSHPLCQCS